MLYFHTMLGSSVSMHGNFHTPKSICCARVKCLHTWKFPYTQKYTGQVFACMEISIHPKVYAVLVCMHGNFHTPKRLCRSVCMLGNFHTPKSVCRSVCMLGNFHTPKVYAVVFACLEISIHPKVYAIVFACLEISIHPKVYAVLGSSVCIHGNFHTPKSTRVKCLPAWKFPYTQKYMPCSFACMEISIHPNVYAVVFACLEISIHPKVYAVVFACLEISIHPKCMP